MRSTFSNRSAGPPEPNVRTENLRMRQTVRAFVSWLRAVRASASPARTCFTFPRCLSRTSRLPMLGSTRRSRYSLNGQLPSTVGSCSPTKTSGGRGDLPTPRRHSVSHRAGSGTHTEAKPAATARSVGREVSSAKGRQARPRVSPADASRYARLELRPADEDERALARRLGVFANGFTLEGAVAVGTGREMDEAHVFDALASLVDKSLVWRMTMVVSGATACSNRPERTFAKRVRPRGRPAPRAIYVTCVTSLAKREGDSSKPAGTRIWSGW